MGHAKALTIFYGTCCTKERFTSFFMRDASVNPELWKPALCHSTTHFEEAAAIRIFFFFFLQGDIVMSEVRRKTLSL